MNTQLPKDETMTLEDFQKKLFWISIITMSGVIALFVYLYSTDAAYTNYQHKYINSGIIV